MGNNCEEGYQGNCCCNCTHQLELFKHPWNKQFKGGIDESTGLFACVGVGKAILMDRQHGSCEMHNKKEQNERD